MKKILVSHLKTSLTKVQELITDLTVATAEAIEELEGEIELTDAEITEIYNELYPASE